jgi:hypothetical protein
MPMLFTEVVARSFLLPVECSMLLSLQELLDYKSLSSCAKYRLLVTALEVSIIVLVPEEVLLFQKREYRELH